MLSFADNPHLYLHIYKPELLLFPHELIHRIKLRERDREKLSLMGNYRFRLSDMMPNAWFYKLKDMSKRRKRNSVTAKKPSYSRQRQPRFLASEPSGAGSVYSRRISDVSVAETPRKSSTIREKRKTIYQSSPVSAGFGSPDPLFSLNYLFFSSTESSSLDELTPHNVASTNSFDEQVSWPSPCNGRITSSTTDIIIDLKKFPLRRKETADRYSLISETLPPVLTKPAKAKDSSFEAVKDKINSSKSEERFSKFKEEDSTSPFSRKSSANFSGIRLRAKSPKLAGGKALQPKTRKSSASMGSSKTKNKGSPLSESCAVVKFSPNPQREFRESMVEMIVENNIRATKDLEELLACYLSLNSDEYHHNIVQAFEQIWFDMAEFRLKRMSADKIFQS